MFYPNILVISEPRYVLGMCSDFYLLPLFFKIQDFKQRKFGSPFILKHRDFLIISKILEEVLD